ncbi:hypothetical protein Droror1_Dr00006634 [Drosera rotundifolia]
MKSRIRPSKSATTAFVRWQPTSHHLLTLTAFPAFLGLAGDAPIIHNPTRFVLSLSRCCLLGCNGSGSGRIDLDPTSDRGRGRIRAPTDPSGSRESISNLYY